MIVWLASYPRSGNRMTRKLLYETMGLRSQTMGLRSCSKQIKGEPWSLILPSDREEFLREASASSELHVIKTHDLPSDSQPALYIVRDGRKSCLSYQHFHSKNTPPPFPSLLDTVMGRDFYGSWSTHYQAWAQRGNVKILRYENLVNAGSELLTEIAQFIGYSGTVRPWVNDFEADRQKVPHLVREGKVEWDGSDPLWTPMIDAVFFYLHGDLMVELGYVDDATRSRHSANIPDGWGELIDACNRYLGDAAAANKVCDERLTVIDMLKKACDERLALIEKLRR